MIFDGEFFFIKLQTFLQCFTVTTKRFANLKVIWNEDFPFSSIYNNNACTLELDSQRLNGLGVLFSFAR